MIGAPAPLRDRLLVVVAALALLAYVPGFWWGAPTATGPDRVQSWGTDDETPLGPLAEMHNIIQPKPDRNLGYPLGYAFMATTAYAPYLLWLKGTGQLHGMSATYPFGLTDPVATLRTLSRIAHAVTVLLAVLAVLGACDAARTLWGNGAGAAAAAFTLTLYPMFYYGRTGNVDVPMLAFFALALAAFARALVHGFTARRVIWLGIFTGLALGTKEGVVGTLAPAGVATLVLGWRSGGWRIPALAALAFVLALGVASGLFVDPHRWVDHVLFIAGRIHDLPSAQALPTAFPFTAAGHLAFVTAITRRLVAAMTVPGLLLGVAGAIWASLRDRRWTLIALMVPAHLALAFFLQRAAYMRYLLPVALVLALFAGWALVTASKSRVAGARVAVVLVAGLTLAAQVMNGASLTYEMIRDSRHAAGRWIQAHVRQGDRIEYFGASQKLPPLPAGVQTARAAPYYGMWTLHDTSAAAAAAIVRRWAADPPALVLVIPDHSSQLARPYDASVPPSLFDSLVAGRAGLRLAALVQTPPLIPWFRRPDLDYPTVNPPIRIFAR